MATEHLIEEYATETIYLLLSPLQKKKPFLSSMLKIKNKIY